MWTLVQTGGKTKSLFFKQKRIRVEKALSIIIHIYKLVMLFYRTVYIVLFLFMNKILIPKNCGAFIYSANIAITHYIYKTKNGNNSTYWPGFFKGIFCILIFCITSLWWYLTHLQHQGTTNCKCLKVYLFILSHSSNFIRNFLFFSHDVTAAMLVSQNSETAAMLLSQTSPVGDKLFPHALSSVPTNLHICWPRE